MSAPSKSTTSDTSFRKTWDRDEYAAKASARESALKEESKARYEAKASGQKYRPRPPTPPDAKETSSRTARLSVSQNVGKTTLVPAGAATGKRGRGAGFYCEECDLTFKDNLQFVEHLNSRQHLVAVGESGEVKRATVEEVRERLEWLRGRREEEERERREGVEKGLKGRLEGRVEREEAEREEKRRVRRENRRKTEGGVGVKMEDVDGEGVGGGIIC